MEKITTQQKTELAGLGMRLRVQHLLQQAGYTLSIAATDGDLLKAILAPGFLELVKKVRDELAVASEDKTIVAAEAKLATSTQNMLVHEAREWTRRAIRRSRSATHAGAEIPDDLIKSADSHRVVEVLAHMDKLITLMSEHAAKMDAVGAPTQPLIDAGRKVRDELSAADVTQAQTRTANLPAALYDFYAKKGELYLGLKMINEAGHELHAGDPQLASRYNFSVLYRKHATGNGKTEPPPGTNPSQLVPT